MAEDLALLGAQPDDLLARHPGQALGLVELVDGPGGADQVPELLGFSA